MDENRNENHGPSPAFAGFITLFFGLMGFFLGSVFGDAGSVAGALVFALAAMGTSIIEAINNK